MSLAQINIDCETLNTINSLTSSSHSENSSFSESTDSTYNEYLIDGYPFEWGSWVLLRNPVSNQTLAGIVVGVTKCGYIRVQVDKKRTTIVRRLPKNLILYHHPCCDRLDLIGHEDDANLIGKIFSFY